MNLYVQYRYRNVGFKFDALIHEILDPLHALRVGGGCCMFGDYERDIQFEIHPKHLKTIESKMQALADAHPNAHLEFGTD